MKALLLLIFALLAATSARAAPTKAARTSALSPLVLTGLRCEQAVDPLGLEVLRPRLSWRLQDTRPSGRGQRQTAYRVLVASTAERLAANAGDVWDSGKVASDQSVLVEYAGKALRSHTAYFWKVQVWDRDVVPTAWSAPGHWSMGVLSPDRFAAQWIGVDSASAGWGDYTVETTFTIAREAAGVFFRAQGGDGYLWQVNASGAQAIFKTHVRQRGNYRVLKTVPLPDFSRDPTARHTLRIQAVGDRIETYVDGHSIDVTTDATFRKGVIGFRESPTETAVFHDVRVTGTDGGALFADSFARGETNRFTGGTMGAEGLTVTNGEAFFANWSEPPLLRRTFTLTKPVRRAWVYASALGVYELRLNGSRVGDGLLAPGWTDYRKRVSYETFDVTGSLRVGANAIGAQLAPGWYAGNIGWFGPNQYGETPRFFAELHVEYVDGTTAIIGTDATWRTGAGPVVAADNLDGESYDARQEQAGWDTPAFRETDWKPVSAVALPDGVRLVARVDPPVRVTQTLPALRRTEPQPGVFVYDLGQDISGVARVALQGKAGATATIRYAEALNADGTLNTATLHSPGIAGAFARATDTYTFARDGAAVFEPRFTWHGFRYVEVTGADRPPTLADVTGRVMGTDVPHVGGLTTSDNLVNRLQSALQWSGRDAFMSIPMDCPQRTERLGWTGDANFYLATATFNFDMARFYAKWEQDIVGGQTHDGLFSNVAPSWGEPGDGGYGGGWGDAGVCVPYAIYQASGDTGIVRESYPAMARWMDCLQARSHEGILPADLAPAGDWQQDNDDTPHDLIATAYFAHDADLMARMADALGKPEDAVRYRALFASIAQAFTARFVAADGTVGRGSQTAAVLALHLHLVPDARRGAIADQLVENIRQHGNRLTTGFVGTQWLLPTLTEVGRPDLAYAILEQTEKPSWGNMLARGSTTIWETWGVMNPDGTINGGANSLNHCALGSCGDWMYANIGAIAPDPAAPGYRNVIVRPIPGGGITGAHAWHDSPYGRIETRWELQKDGRFTLDVTVPVNATATVFVPSASAAEVTESKHPASRVPGLQFVRREPGYTVFTIGAGTYHFASVPSK